MDYTNRYKNTGWYNESQRHSLAAQGIPTTVDNRELAIERLKNMGSSAMTGIRHVASETAMGLKDLSEDRELGATQDGVTSIEYSTSVGSQPAVDSRDEMEKIKHEEEIESEIAELESTEQPILGETSIEKIKRGISSAISSAARAIRQNDPDVLGDKISELSTHKETIDSKIVTLTSLRNRILDPKHRQNVGINTQFGELETVDAQIGPLKAEQRRAVREIGVAESRLPIMNVTSPKSHRNRDIDIDEPFNPVGDLGNALGEVFSGIFTGK